MAVAGGAARISAGLAASTFIWHFAGWSTLVSAVSILLGLLFSALVGVSFGYDPTRKAGFMDPIEAPRYE